MIINPTALLAEIHELYDNGLPSGSKTGWTMLDKYYTVKTGQWTLVTGIPGHGKSEWVDALMVNLANQKWRFAIFSPENHPLEMHCAKIIEKKTGKPFTHGPTERASKDEVEKAVEWMGKHFVFIKTETPNMREILTEGVNKVAGYPQMPGGIVIDPWNQLEHYRPSGMTETEYISQALSEVIWFARENNVHIWIIAHPMKLQKENGKYPVPTPYDVAGSAHWRNKADNCLCVWRDEKEVNQFVELHVQKVRFKNIGRVGRVDFRYDKVTGRYHDVGDKAPVYSLTDGSIAI